jgi:hypothetical protein
MGPTLASFTMSNNLWLPFWINIVLLMCAVPAIGMLPGIQETPATIMSADDGDHIAEEAGPLLRDSDFSPDRHANAFEAQPSIPQSIVHAIRKMVHLVTGRRNFQVLLCSFFLTALASSDTKLLVQYISKRYEWTFAEVGNPMFTLKITLLTHREGRLHALSKSIRKLRIARHCNTAHYPVVYVLENGPRF